MNIAPNAMSEHILAMLQVCYGEEFQKKFANNSTPEMLIAGLNFVLDGLTAQEIQNGLNRMKTEKWCPSLPEFRSWCEAGSEWWNAELAWAKGLQFLANDSVQITTLTKCVLDEVKCILDNEGQWNAHKAFIVIYDDYLAKAKKAGKKQRFYEVQQKLPAPEELDNREVCKGIPSDLRKQLFKAVEQERTVEEIADEQRANREKTLKHFQKLGEVA